MELSSLEGRLLAGRFQLGERLGQGGYGAVFKAEQVSMGRTCAVKVLAPRLVESDDTLKRFELEARATSRLNHPNTVVVYDFGRDDSTGLLFLAMEYLEGDDLDAFVNKRGPLSVAPVLHILEQMAGSLQDAHDAGLVHRDIKPKNAMVSPRGSDPLFVKVIDFGISKAFDPIQNQSASFLELTETGMVIGTPQYMSPEQLRNAAVDGRSDQYALAITAYRMLTGRTPFQGASLVDVAVKHISETPLPLRAYRPGLKANAALEGVFLRALSKEPDDRFDSMNAFVAAMRAAAEGLDDEGEDAPSEPWAAGETGSLAFLVEPAIETDETDETASMAGEALPAERDPSIAFARTAAAPKADSQPIHLGGTLANEKPRAAEVSGDDAPGGTLVVLREGHFESAGRSDEELEGAAPEERSDQSAIPSEIDVRQEEWSMGSGDVALPDPSLERRSRSILLAVVVIALLGVGGASTAAILFADRVDSGAEGTATVGDMGSKESGEVANERVPAEDVGVAVGIEEPEPGVKTSDVKPARTTVAEPDPTDSSTAGAEQDTSVGAGGAKRVDPREEKVEVEPVKDSEPDLSKERGGPKEAEGVEKVEPGTARVILVPWGSLFVDGRHNGDEPRQKVTLSPGTYTFELRQNGDVKDRARVTVKAGQSTSIRLRAK